MRKEIVYCDGCGRLIMPSQIESGEAVVTPIKSLCPACLRAVGPGEREEFKALSAMRDAPDTLPLTPLASGTPAGRRPRESKHSTAATPAGPSTATLAVASFVVAAALAAAVTLLALPSGDSDRRAASTPTPPLTVATPPAAGPPRPGEATTGTSDTAAARRLAKIRSMRTPNLWKYAEIRGTLVSFPEYFAGTSEAEQSRALLFEIDVAYAQLADEALATAISAAQASASRGDVDGAVSGIRSVASRFGAGPWLTTTGEAKIAAAVDEIERRRAAPQRTDAAQLPGPPEAPSRTGPASPEERALRVFMAEFDTLMSKPDYAEASRFAQAGVAKPANALHADALRAAARVATILRDRPAAIVKGARTLVGTEIGLRTKTGTLTGELKEATERGLVMATSYTINREKKERLADVSWSSLAPAQEDEFAAKGGPEADPADLAVARAYAGLAGGDADAASAALEAAGNHGLVAHLTRRIADAKAQAAYDAAMAEARRLVGMRRWKDALEALDRALRAKPDDADATALLADVRRHIEPAPTLALELAPGVTMEFVYVRPGTFVMGGDSDSKHGWQRVEKPPHEVTITKGFYLGKYEVTRGQFAAFANATGHKTDAEREGKSRGRRADGGWGDIPGSSWRDTVVFPQTDDHPVVSISWNDAKAFCDWAAGKTRSEVRLPTEAEWEYACRAGSTATWSHGDDAGRVGEFAWFSGNSGWAIHAVGQKKPNAWGLYDIHGNVWELVADWASDSYYASSPAADPTGPPSGDRRVHRGGSWDHDSWYCRCAVRFTSRGTRDRITHLGLRAAVSAPQRTDAAQLPGPPEAPSRTGPASPEERALRALMTEFDALMSKPDYAEASRFAQAGVAKPANALHADALRAAARVATILRDRPAAIVKGARTLVGTEIGLRTKTGTLTGELKEATERGLVMATSYTINREKKERLADVSWSSLAPAQEDEFAAKGGPEADPADLAVARAYAGLAGGDADAASAALEAAGNHGLVAHLTRRIADAKAQAAYDAAMAEARRLVGMRRWKDAPEALDRALRAKPDDAEATALLAEVRRHIEPDLLAWWRFDEGLGITACDSSGQGKHGTLTDMSVSQWTTDAVSGHALAFDGANDSVACGTSIALANESFSFTAWVKRASTGEMYFLGQNTAPTGNQALHVGFLDADTFRFAFFGNDLDSDSAAYADTDWQHLAGTYDAATNSRRIYRDGVEMASDTAGADYQGSGPFYLGRKWDGAYFNGSLDDVRIYGRVLSPTEVLDLYGSYFAGIEAEPVTGLVTTEAGGQATFRVRPVSQPEVRIGRLRGPARPGAQASGSPARGGRASSVLYPRARARKPAVYPPVAGGPRGEKQRCRAAGRSWAGRPPTDDYVCGLPDLNGYGS